MDGREFLQVTESLCKSIEKRPAFMRTAISRAYYAAHHYARQTLRSLDCPVMANSRGHSDKWQALGKVGDRRAKEAAGMLSDLYEQRRQADCELDKSALERPTNGDHAFDVARDFVARLKRCENNADLRDRVRVDLKQAGLS